MHTAKMIAIGENLNHQMRIAVTKGIQTIFHDDWCLMSLIAGTNIIATTQGRIPRKILSTISLSLY